MLHLVYGFHLIKGTERLAYSQQQLHFM